ncbi:1-phosphofructokinase family hexose kinase [Ramlibacter sp. AW1]|uniref:Phosphofructokinase n=1 Tax=Ramlibacter aurantiacus TaxID=2801330 RepID=A0A936ZMN7_9BURK|nr:1-phosphofructokinase family hexose kinase [Ramlibacter aurantiacus]MBL0419006.1 1-phosphofructokinase family hexose kinase [Ramlibacter aurantiacus]
MTLLTFTPNPAVDLATRTPRIEPTHKLRCTAAQVHPGGGGINVARVIARLGGTATAVYPAGGPAGERLQQLVAAEGVHARVVRIAGETRENFSVLDEGSGDEYRFVLPGPTLSGREWLACLEHVAAAVPDSGWVVASGSLPLGVASDGYAQLAGLLAPHGAHLVLDASGPSLASALQAGVHLVKPSLRELQELTGHALPDTPSRLAACRGLIERGQARWVALSMGAEGALLVGAGGAWKADAVPVTVASTIGAGDSFLAGLVWVLSREDHPEEALRFAMAAAAAALLQPGTALCDPAQVQRLLPQVRVEAVAF